MCFLSFLLPVAERLHKAIAITVSTMKTTTHHEQQVEQPEVRQVASKQ
jgi:hypothetical protein